MFDEKVKNILTKIGLTDVQSRMYIIILKSGGIKISRAAKLLQINRTNAYQVVDKLKELGLIWESLGQNGKVLQAYGIEVISKKLNLIENEFSDLNTRLQSMEPFFRPYMQKQNLKNASLKSFIGSEGLDLILDDIIEASKNTQLIYLFTNQSTERNMFSRYKHESFVKNRIKNKIFIKVLAVNNKEGHSLQRNDEKYFRKTNFLPKNFDFFAETYIYANKVAMIDFNSDIIGMVFESDELFKIQKSLFEFMWESCEG